MSVLLFPRFDALSFFLGATLFFNASRFRRLPRLFYPLRFLGATQLASATNFFRRRESSFLRLSGFFFGAKTLLFESPRLLRLSGFFCAKTLFLESPRFFRLSGFLFCAKTLFFESPRFFRLSGFLFYAKTLFFESPRLLRLSGFLF